MAWRKVRSSTAPSETATTTRAASLAAELNAETEHEAEIEEGGKSQYDVLADDELIFSKQQEGRFPEHSEIRALLAEWPHCYEGRREHAEKETPER